MSLTCIIKNSPNCKRSPKDKIMLNTIVVIARERYYNGENDTPQLSEVEFLWPDLNLCTIEIKKIKIVHNIIRQTLSNAGLTGRRNSIKPRMETGINLYEMEV